MDGGIKLIDNVALSVPVKGVVIHLWTTEQDVRKMVLETNMVHSCTEESNCREKFPHNKAGEPLPLLIEVTVPKKLREAKVKISDMVRITMNLQLENDPNYLYGKRPCRADIIRQADLSIKQFEGLDPEQAKYFSEIAWEWRESQWHEIWRLHYEAYDRTPLS
ncbi:hypothetical protein [Streptomyces sp. CoH17]|uniref:hypothetical protein n=1 Tax=Streptomyces sp. CoH17 TaxID=2992806 RepID=UPI0022715D20|nr:hypothetical protein [Streptomyces sp. CoH17]